MNLPEVLCPAGDFDAVKAAVLNGANAVYIGGKQFSARKNASNFDEHELIEVVKYCHIRGARVYLALNTIVFNRQLDDVMLAIQSACNAGVDALIVQDLGVLRLAQKIAPTLPIHASTQMSVHTKKGAELLLKLGIKRVVLARELSIEEIADICTLPIEVEVFVHGALCMSVSGQCYISGMIGGRSGNRGNCAGTCRLPFSVDGKGKYALSLKDSCLAPYVDQLAKAGVRSLKIEGRMKRPEYVAAAAKVYSSAVKRLPYDVEILQAVFSRDGFTDGYISGGVNATMFGYRGKEDVLAATSKILKQLENTYKKEVPLVAIDLHFTLKRGSNITLSAIDVDGNSATASLDSELIQEAISAPTTALTAERSLAKLGSTPFFLRDFTADIDNGLMIPSATLNELRRIICELLMSQRVGKSIPVVEYSEQFNNSPQHSTIRARFRTFEQISGSTDFIILPLVECENHFSELTKIQHKVIIEPDRIMFKSEGRIVERLQKLRSCGFSHLLCDNLAHIEIGKSLGFTLHGGAYLNCTNSVSAKALEELGLSDITLSFEGELAHLNQVRSFLPSGIISYGYLPLMVIVNCPVMAQNGNCKDCSGQNEIVDRMDAHFPVLCHQKQYVEVLNCNCLYMADRLNESKQSFHTLYFTTETKAECESILAQYGEKAAASGSFTRGLYYRSI